MSDTEYDNPEIHNFQVTGKVKWYNVKEGFGFIHRDDNDEDIFIHRSGIKAFSGNFPSLDGDEDVIFDVISGPKGLQAIHVTGPNGDAVRGSKYSPNRNRGGRSNQNDFYRNESYGGNEGFDSYGYRGRNESRPFRRGGYNRGNNFRGGRGFNNFNDRSDSRDNSNYSRYNSGGNRYRNDQRNPRGY